MGVHSKKDVEELAQQLTARYEKLLGVLQGESKVERLLPELTASKRVIRSEEIHFAVDDLATALKRIKSRLGKD